MTEKPALLLLGGDGYIGWPLALRLSETYAVHIIDNLQSRHLVDGCLEGLPLPERVQRWKDMSGQTITFEIADVTDPDVVYASIQKKPQAVLHLAEIKAAPYSMRRPETSLHTLQNNLVSTHHLLWAVRQFSPDTHIIKLGSMGEYGTPPIDIEEGFVEIAHRGRTGTLLYPRTPGSIYHASKVMDTDLLYLGARLWGLTVSDIMQGPVYGYTTKESHPPELRTHFPYGAEWGTVINRFVLQAVCGIPLTVYGTGGQTRGFLSLEDVLRCIEAILRHPDGYQIYNQFGPLSSIQGLARLVQKIGNQKGQKVSIQHLPNPRYEEEAHYYNPVCQKLPALGVSFDDLEAGILALWDDLVPTTIDRSFLYPEVTWR
jgi:UDP-sulfoquinovose synthase